MRLTRFVAPALAVLLGLVSPAIADEWGGKGAIAEAWFFGLAPMVIEAAGPGWAWVAASAAYALQFLALFAVLQPVLEPFKRLAIRRRAPR